MAHFSTFDARKAAQVAAFMLHRAGGRLPVIKLVKLMYLAERASLLTYGEPLIGDGLVSMQHGPVLSTTYNQLNGNGDQQGQVVWDSWIDARENHEVSLKEPQLLNTPEIDLLNLSESDLDVLQIVWTQFGHWDKWKLRDYTHTQACPEWQDPEGSSLPITYERLFEVSGKSKAHIEATLLRLNEQALVNQAFASALV
jgi:uncharacterized phage-associated protein